MIKRAPFICEIKFDRLSLWSSVPFSNKMGKFLFWIHGVEAKKDIKFNGLPHIRRSSSAKILVGNACTFRSSATSNLIGINSPCIFNAGENSVIFAGSEVTKDITANLIAAGNPCRVLKQINK